MPARAQGLLLAFCAIPYEDVALNELGAAVDARPRRRLAPGVWLLEAPGEDEVRARIDAAPPIFTRQIVVDVIQQPCTGDPDRDAATVAPILGPAGDICAFLPDGRVPPAVEALRAAVAAAMPPRSERPARERPLALIVAGDTLLAGRLLAGAGLPVARPAPLWPAGRPDFPQPSGLVSRSALKLLEALAFFDPDLGRASQALDLGAAPGGWTQVLAARGLVVTAVDPAALDPRVAALPGVSVERTTAQRFFARADTRYDLIVDDMRQDARASARIMVQAADLLSPGGVALLTLKLPEHGPTAVLRSALEILRRRFIHLQARCLSFNRREVTVFLPSR